ncbi:nucleotidyltransferase domain-containing protein [Natrarchaeobius chitinivorans]|uniref:Nucleotidyltransferase n=1 Tax=Natrarchaeobius chitinivorans TaxID=1679083 RepID=A0A3N6N645_NATCH|nr:nucleotidyltransferase domain-containing protein [Natrarchaeobius chitinivorans]RQG93812.1 nucleotidyltransferase [Natrarchaeobius chitinivorans]
MSHQTNSDGGNGTSISLSIPVLDPDLFKRKATDDALLFLTNHRFRQFSLREVANQIGHSQQTVRRAIDTLIENDLVVESPDGNQRLVQINRQRLSIPDDPLLRIPQADFQEPVKAAVDSLATALDDLLAVVLYGSVARGEADRRSDIDLWVLTRKNRAANQREANAVARDLEEEEFDGDRYAYDIDVETVQAIPTYTEDIREIVVSGIPVYRTDDFATVENLLLTECGEGE